MGGKIDLVPNGTFCSSLLQHAMTNYFALSFLFPSARPSPVVLQHSECRVFLSTFVPCSPVISYRNAFDNHGFETPTVCFTDRTVRACTIQTPVGWLSEDNGDVLQNQPRRCLTLTPSIRCLWVCRASGASIVALFRPTHERLLTKLCAVLPANVWTQ